MGRDKALVRLGGKALIDHVRAAAKSLRAPVRIIQRDCRPGRGPVGGIHTGLTENPRELLYFLSCDMPFVSGELLRNLRQKLGSESLAIFVQRGAQVGFPCLLRRQALAVVEAQLADPQASLQKLAAALGAQTLRPPRARQWELFNINTPDELIAAGQFWRRRQEGQTSGGLKKARTVSAAGPAPE